MLPKSFYCLIATLNGCSILSNICSGIFVCRVYNIREIVYYRILALESLLITLFSTLSFIANILSLVGYVRTDKEAWSCAIVCGTATMSVMIGMVCSALASFYRYNLNFRAKKSNIGLYGLSGLYGLISLYDLISLYGPSGLKDLSGLNDLSGN